jgi:succinate-acetate transporter protein
MLFAFLEQKYSVRTTSAAVSQMVYLVHIYLTFMSVTSTAISSWAVLVFRTFEVNFQVLSSCQHTNNTQIKRCSFSVSLFHTLYFVPEALRNRNCRGRVIFPY